MTSQARILVADDDPALCLLLRETLQDAGYEVSIANDGDQLVRMAQDQTPDLILVDLMMPLMDGFEAIRQLRNDTRTSHLPMIILTARSASAEVVTGFDSGADDYIVKPYDIDVLLARIRSHLRRAAQLPVRNPLTGLPGNVLLQAELERQLAQGTPFALLYIDLDNFKAFNDAYGFARGDRAIHALASVLGEVAPRDDFLGHIGGDDFAIIHYGGDVDGLCQQIIAAFNARVRDLYDSADLSRGYLQGIDRYGVQRQFRLLSLSISVVSSQPGRFASVDELSKVAAELKGVAKQTAGNSFVIDRRRRGSQRPQEERRGQSRPAALLIFAGGPLQASLVTTLRLQGYRPLIAANVVDAQDQLARTPDPVLLVADAAAPELWSLWMGLATPAPLIALAADESTAQAALARGATAAILISESPIELTDRLLQHLPRAETSETPEAEAQQARLIRDLQTRALHLEREANEDSLTGLFNRRYIDRTMPALLDLARHNDEPLIALMADLDHFKQVNDLYSHMAGNEVLRVTGDLLRANLRPADIAARYGGEEFVVLLPETEMDEAAEIAERIRAAVEGYDWGSVVPGLHLTISIGVAPVADGAPDQALAEADAQLYNAKRGGRNRVAVAG